MNLNPKIYQREFYYFENEEIKKINLWVCDVSHVIKHLEPSLNLNEGYYSNDRWVPLPKRNCPEKIKYPSRSHRALRKDIVWDKFVINPKHDEQRTKQIIEDIMKMIRFRLIGKHPKSFKTNAKEGEDYYIISRTDAGFDGIYFSSKKKYFARESHLAYWNRSTETNKKRVIRSKFSFDVIRHKEMIRRFIS